MLDMRKRESPKPFPLKTYDDIYFDTCAILEEGFRGCLRRIIPDLIRAEKRILIPYPVMQELSYLADGMTSNCSQQAGQARKLVCKLAQEGLVQYTGDDQISEQADHYFVRTVSTDRFRRRIAVITQDRQLTEDLNLLNRVGTVQAKPVHTYKLERGAPVCTKNQLTPGRTAGNAAAIFRRLGL